MYYLYVLDLLPCALKWSAMCMSAASSLWTACSALKAAHSRQAAVKGDTSANEENVCGKEHEEEEHKAQVLLVQLMLR